MAAFQRLEPLPILAEIHVVGNLGAVVDVHDVHGVLLVSVLARIASCSTVILRCERLSREPRRMFVWHFSFNNHPSRLAKRSHLRTTAVFAATLSSYRTAPSGRCHSGAARRPRRPRWGARTSCSSTPSRTR